MPKQAHQPVLLKDVLSYLRPKPGHMVLDGTVGSAGHARAILAHIGPKGFLIGLDQDQQAIDRAQKQLEQVGGNFILKCSHFVHLGNVLDSLNLSRIHAVLLDIGVSTEQLEDRERGFGFRTDGPLDMRMDPVTQTVTAAGILETKSIDDLTWIFRTYGEERYARGIARKIVEIRQTHPIRTTTELRTLIERLTPARRRFGRIHPATRVFQALRIAVNGELDALKEVLPRAFGRLEVGGRLAVISFHSLEDRIVKHTFLSWKKDGSGEVLTKKPVRPDSMEVAENPRARSAKLRVVERKS